MAGSIYQSNTSFGSYTLTSWYNSSFILVKYDPHGHVIWARQSQTNVVGTQDNFAQSVAIDASANVYVTGVFFSEISFGTHRINDTDAGDVVLVKYDSSGNAVWVTSGVTSQVGAVAIGNSVATDLSGNSYITGMYVGSIQFGSFSLTSAGENIFIVKYNPAGNVIWAKTATIVPNNINTYWEGTALVTDNSKYLYLTASGNSNSIKFTTETFSPNSIIVKFDSNGNDL